MQLGDELAEPIAGEYLLQIQSLSSYSTVELTVRVHSHFHVDITCSGMDEAFQLGFSQTVPVEDAVHLQVTYACQFFGQTEHFAEEVQAGLRESRLIHLQMPGGLLVPVLQPAIHVDVNILLLSEHQ